MPFKVQCPTALKQLNMYEVYLFLGLSSNLNQFHLREHFKMRDNRADTGEWRKRKQNKISIYLSILIHYLKALFIYVSVDLHLAQNLNKCSMLAGCLKIHYKCIFKNSHSNSFFILSLFWSQIYSLGIKNIFLAIIGKMVLICVWACNLQIGVYWDYHFRI